MVLQTLSGVLIIAIFVQLFKSFLEAFGLAPEHPLHDPLVWLLAFASGIGGYIGVAVIQGPPLTGSLALTAMGQGLLASFSAVGSYSLVTHPYFANTNTVATLLRRAALAPAPPAPPPAPPSAPPAPPLPPPAPDRVGVGGPGLTILEAAT